MWFLSSKALSKLCKWILTNFDISLIQSINSVSFDEKFNPNTYSTSLSGNHSSLERPISHHFSPLSNRNLIFRFSDDTSDTSPFLKLASSCVTPFI